MPGRGGREGAGAALQGGTAAGTQAEGAASNTTSVCLYTFLSSCANTGGGRGTWSTVPGQQRGAGGPRLPCPSPRFPQPCSPGLSGR